MFMFLTTDAFSAKTARERQKVRSSVEVKGDETQRRLTSIRRPYRGIQIKEDTYSTLSIRKPNGDPILLTSSTSMVQENGIGKVVEYADYILQSVQDNRVEKSQVIETFGEPFIYFYGERPRVTTFSGVLISTEDFNWRSQFWKNYNEHIRGTRLVQQNARAYLCYDTIIIEGYPLSASAVDSSDSPYTLPFSFEMFVTGYYDWSDIGQTRFPGKDSYVDLDALNSELADSRGKFISSSSRVRLKNLGTKEASGIGALLRKAAKEVNEITSIASNIVDQLHNVIGGRVVRVPIGVAGYYQNTGEATVAAGSLDSPIFSNPGALGKQYDAATGQYKNVSGSVKLRMPAYAKYGTPWTSPLTGRPGGYIFENKDEYPTFQSPVISKLKADRLGSNSLAATEKRNQERLARLSKRDAELVQYNLRAQAGGALGTLTEYVGYAKSAFGMAVTAGAFAANASYAVRKKGWENAIKSALGIQSVKFSELFDSPIRTFETYFELISGSSDVYLENVTLEESNTYVKNTLRTDAELEAAYAPSQYTENALRSEKDLTGAYAPSQYTPQELRELSDYESTYSDSPTSKYMVSGRQDKLQSFGITSAATEVDDTWLGAMGSQTYQDALEPGTEVDVGEAYQQLPYLSPATQGEDAEETYTPSPYESSASKDEQYEKAYATSDYTSVARDPEARKALEEEFGDIDSTSVGDRGGLEATYSSGTKSLFTRTPADIARILESLNSAPQPNPNDTNGIRGIEDEDAEIEPVL